MAKGLHWTEEELNNLNLRKEKARINTLKQEVKQAKGLEDKPKKSIRITVVSNVKYRFIIGVDCGVSTGIAVYDTSLKGLIKVDTLMIHQAMDYVLKMHTNHILSEIFVRVEDARLNS